MELHVHLHGDIHVHHHNSGEVKVLEILNYLKTKIDFMAKTQAELVVELNGITTQVAKLGEESKQTLQKVIDLQTIIDNQGGVTPELQAAVDALKAQVTVVDDLIPDVTPPVV